MDGHRKPGWSDVFPETGMSKLNYFRSFLELPRIALPLLSLMTFAAQELPHQAMAKSSFSSPTPNGESSRNDLVTERQRTLTHTSNPTSIASTNAIAPPETLEASSFSQSADRLDRAQASQRSLTVRQVQGRVTYSLPGTGERPVQVGDRLSAGEGELITDQDSSVKLELDNQMGLVEVSENTSLQIKTLSGSDDENSETVFFVSRGQARLSLRPIRPTANDVSDVTAPSDGARELLVARTPSTEGKTAIDSAAPLLAQRRSRRRNYPVRVQTPAGIAGVRGTSFGVNVGPDGKTGIEIIKGSVAAIAGDEEVIVEGGQAVAIPPGESPTPPKPAPKLTTLRIRSLVRTSLYTAVVSGQVDPTDIVFINDKPIKIDSEGKFKATVALPPSLRLNFVVRSPAVGVRYYELTASSSR